MQTTLLNGTNIKKAHRQGKDGTCEFNCWGTTLFILSQTDKLEWVGSTYMKPFLKNKTMPKVNQGFEKGDILVLWGNAWHSNGVEHKELIHTAVYVGNGKFFHKKGMDESCYDTLEDVLHSYLHDNYEIRQLI